MSAANKGPSEFSATQLGTVDAQVLLLQGECQIARELHSSASQQLAAQAQLVTGIAHDFNNVLTVIMGYADLALQKRLLSAANPEDLIQIKKATERAACLVRHLLACSRPESQRDRYQD